MRPRAIEYRDCQFARKLLLAGRNGGAPQHQWVDYGMPRLDQRILSTVFYLYGRDPKSGKVRGPLGTGVFILKPSNINPNKFHVYAVTAHHVIKSGASIIGVRSHDPNATGPIFAEYDPSEWWSIPDGDDIAIVDVTDVDPLPVGGVPVDWIVTPEFVDEVDLGAGDDGFMLGLFVKHPGAPKINPAVRFGNISIMPSNANPIEQGNGIKRPSFVFDMHSRPGFSGSPVFVYRTPANALTGIDPSGSGHWSLDTKNNIFVKLLGIHSGQFTEGNSVRKSEAYGSPTPIIEGDNLELPSSMTVVVPASAIRHIIYAGEAKKVRAQREKRLSKEWRRNVRPEAVQVEPESDNPAHKEDFTRLLGAAATTKPKA